MQFGIVLDHLGPTGAARRRLAGVTRSDNENEDDDELGEEGNEEL